MCPINNHAALRPNSIRFVEIQFENGGRIDVQVTGRTVAKARAYLPMTETFSKFRIVEIHTSGFEKIRHIHLFRQ